MYNNLSNKENLKRLKLLLQMKKEIRKLERKLRYSNSFFYVNIIDSKNKDSSLKNKELTKKLLNERIKLLNNFIIISIGI